MAHLQYVPLGYVGAGGNAGNIICTSQLSHVYIKDTMKSKGRKTTVRAAARAGLR